MIQPFSLTHRFLANEYGDLSIFFLFRITDSIDIAEDKKIYSIRREISHHVLITI